MQQFCCVTFTGHERQAGENAKTFACFMEFLVGKWANHCCVDHGVHQK